MPTQLEYATLAAFVYNNERGNRTVENRLLAPQGWDQLRPANGFPAQTGYNDNFFSFTAGAFVDSSTGEIVISYKGTDFLLELSARGWNTAGDMVTDVAAGVGAGLSVAQFAQAAAYYEDVKSWAIAHSYDPDKISFTGHSLGAGLASVMSVWFNHPATIFADAPFEPTATSLTVTTGIAATLLASGGISDPDFNAFIAALVGSGSSLFSTRESKVTNYYNQGEFLDYLRNSANTVYGSTSLIDIGDQPISRALALHSMNLHAAFLFDDPLRVLVKAAPQLLTTLLDTRLYTSDPNYVKKDLITSLVNDQIHHGFGNDSALQRFSSDLAQIATPSGMAGQPGIQKSLIVAAMEYYYFNNPESTTALFSTGGNGIHFDFSRITHDQAGLKSPHMLWPTLFSYLSAPEWSAVSSRLLTSTAWDIQAGELGAGMNWTAGSAASEVMVGGAGTDILQGGSGSDILIGGYGQDFLTAGTGNDTLLGGQGNDDYRLSGAFGTDIVLDSDGLGLIQLDGVTLGAAKASGKNVWTSQSSVGSVGYALFDDPLSSTGKSLVVTRSDGVGTITIRDFDLVRAASPSGYLGIKLQSAAATFGTVAPDQLFAGTPVTQTSLSSDGSRTFTTVLALPTSAAQALQVTLAGDSGDDFALSTGSTLIRFIDGKASVALPAGTGSLPLSLVNIGDPGASEQLQLNFALLDADGTDTGLAINSLAVDYTEATANPTPSNVVVGQTLPNNPVTYYDGGNPTTNDLIVTTGSSPNNIRGYDGADSIASGLGNDTIVTGNGNSTISGGGGHDNILVHGGNNAIYATGVTDLATALQNARTGLATHQPGTLIGTGDGNNTLFGGNGDDLILVGQGDNVIVAGPGANIIVAGNAVTSEAAAWSGNVAGPFSATYPGIGLAPANYPSPARYEGNSDISTRAPVGIGNDTIYAGSGNSLILLSNGDNYVDAGGGNSSISGGMGRDTIFGSTGNVSVYGGGGDTYIDGESGNDSLVGGGGNNTIFGGTGNDTIFAGDDFLPAASFGSTWDRSATGNNYVDAGSGNSRIYGSGGNDTLLGGTGNVTIYAGSGNEYIDSGDGNDSINGGSGNDTIIAGSGNDTIFAGSGATTIYGGDGVDYIVGGAGDNLLYAGDGGVVGAPTTVLAGEGATTIYGGYGADVLLGGAGTDVIHVGDGGTAYVPALVSAGTGDTTIYGGGGVAHIFGGSGTDVIYAGDGGTDDAPTEVIAGSGDTIMYGGDGTAVLQGGSGSNTLVAGSGNETLLGGSGSNTFVLNPGFGDIVIGYTSPTSANVIQFGAGIDPAQLTVTGAINSDGNFALEIDGGSGSVSIVGGVTDIGARFQFGSGPLLSEAALLRQVVAVSDTVAGDHGVLGFSVDNDAHLTAGAGNDTIVSWGNSATLTGGSGNAIIAAMGAGSRLQGGTGNDTLVAAGTNDSLVAGTGKTTLIGGTGANSFGLSHGGIATIQAQTGTESQVITLAPGQQLTDMTAWRGGMDLYVESATYDTTAIVKGYFGPDFDASPWTIASDSGVSTNLASWVASRVPIDVPGTTYRPDGSFDTILIDAAGNTTRNHYTAVQATVNSQYLYVDGEVTRSNSYPAPATISQYSIGADGELSSLGAPTITTGSNQSSNDQSSVTVDPTGRFAYVTDTSSNLSNVVDGRIIGTGGIFEYSIGVNGQLTPISVNPVLNTGFGGNRVVIDPSGKHAYVMDRQGAIINGVRSGDAISEFTINADGTLTASGTVQISQSSSEAYPDMSFVITPSGKFAFATTGGGEEAFHEFSIDPAGALIPMIAVTPPSGPGSGVVSATINPSGQFLYVVNSRPDGSSEFPISEYKIDAAGSLVLQQTIHVEAGPTLTFDTTGKYAYAIDNNYNDGIGGRFVQFSVDSSGLLVPMATPLSILAGRYNLNSLIFDSSGRYAYVKSGGVSSPIEVLKLSITADGALSLASSTGTPAVGEDSYSMAVASATAGGTHNVLADDSWNNADGSYGWDVYNSDGSSTGFTRNADRTISRVSTQSTGFRSVGTSVDYASNSNVPTVDGAGTGTPAPAANNFGNIMAANVGSDTSGVDATVDVVQDGIATLGHAMVSSMNGNLSPINQSAVQATPVTASYATETKAVDAGASVSGSAVHPSLVTPTQVFARNLSASSLTDTLQAKPGFVSPATLRAHGLGLAAADGGANRLMGFGKLNRGVDSPDAVRSAWDAVDATFARPAASSSAASGFGGIDAPTTFGDTAVLAPLGAAIVGLSELTKRNYGRVSRALAE